MSGLRETFERNPLKRAWTIIEEAVHDPDNVIRVILTWGYSASLASRKREKAIDLSSPQGHPILGYAEFQIMSAEYPPIASQQHFVAQHSKTQPLQLALPCLHPPCSSSNAAISFTRNNVNKEKEKDQRDKSPIQLLLPWLHLRLLLSHFPPGDQLHHGGRWSQHIHHLLNLLSHPAPPLRHPHLSRVRSVMNGVFGSRVMEKVSQEEALCPLTRNISMPGKEHDVIENAYVANGNKRDAKVTEAAILAKFSFQCDLKQRTLISKSFCYCLFSRCLTLEGEQYGTKSLVRHRTHCLLC